MVRSLPFPPIDSHRNGEQSVLERYRFDASMVTTASYVGGGVGCFEPTPWRGERPTVLAPPFVSVAVSAPPTSPPGRGRKLEVNVPLVSSSSDVMSMPPFPHALDRLDDVTVNGLFVVVDARPDSVVDIDALLPVVVLVALAAVTSAGGAVMVARHLSRSIRRRMQHERAHPKSTSTTAATAQAAMM